MPMIYTNKTTQSTHAFEGSKSKEFDEDGNPNSQVIKVHRLKNLKKKGENG